MFFFSLTDLKIKKTIQIWRKDFHLELTIISTIKLFNQKIGDLLQRRRISYICCQKKKTKIITCWSEILPTLFLSFFFFLQSYFEYKHNRLHDLTVLPVKICRWKLNYSMLLLNSTFKNAHKTLNITINTPPSMSWTISKVCGMKQPCRKWELFETKMWLIKYKQ